MGWRPHSFATFGMRKKIVIRVDEKRIEYKAQHQTVASCSYHNERGFYLFEINKERNRKGSKSPPNLTPED